jgi:peptidoglycan/xylan/chitin deacetylase (PgdA/CDA1 family)
MEARRSPRHVMTYALIYHDVVEPDRREETGFGGALAGRYKLSPERFEAHLDRIAHAGVEIGTLDGGPARPQAVLTFDDGGASALRVAGALDRRGWRGHFFITTERIGTPGFLGGRDIQDLVARGHVVGSHSHTHPTYLGKLPLERIRREWELSASALTDLLGERPWSASVPGGYLTRPVIAAAAEAGYRLLMTSEPTAREQQSAGMTVMGRYTIWDTTPARQAAGYARGALVPRTRLWIEWNAKRVPKRLSPQLYQALRRLRARR